jgi:hypothetical protein
MYSVWRLAGAGLHHPLRVGDVASLMLVVGEKNLYLSTQITFHARRSGAAGTLSYVFFGCSTILQNISLGHHLLGSKVAYHAFA